MGTSRPALLIVTHIDWDHAWQRPQAIATALARDFDVTVVSPVARRRSQLSRNPRRGLRVVRVWRLPGSLRSAPVFRLNNRLVAAQVGNLARHLAFSALVVTAPECAAWIENATAAEVFYDCMDDALAFPQDDRVRELRSVLERGLLARARHVFCSSDELALRCAARGAADERVSVVANGYDPLAFPIDPSSTAPRGGELILGYFGTIADWLDVDLLHRLVTADSRLTIDLIGPGALPPRFAHPRLRVFAPMPHRELRGAVSNCHAMILPFRDTPLTRAVDPVKMYEYLALGKPVLCPALPVLAKFSPFATLYRDAAECVALVASRAIASPATREARAQFLADSTWQQRADSMARTIFARHPLAQSTRASIAQRAPR